MRPLHPRAPVVAFVVLVVSSPALAEHASAPAAHRLHTDAHAVCLRPAVRIHRMDAHGDLAEPLTDCNGNPTAHALAAVSALAAPGRTDAVLPDLEPIAREIRRVAFVAGWTLADTPHRTAPTACPPGREPVVVAATPGTQHGARRAHARSRTVCREIELAHDPHTHDPMLVVDDQVRILHPRLIAMLEQIAQHFPGRRIEIVSGYRPSSDMDASSRHAHARALDFRVNGVSREALRDFARTLPNAGVGYYPNSIFVHMDVRDADEGPARWTDYSGQGETPRYGHWPPRETDVQREASYAARQAERALESLRDAGMGAPASGARGAPLSPEAGESAEAENAR